MTIEVWRIGTNRALELNDLSYGSTLFAGRWHEVPPVGVPVVYAASSRALCQLEKRVHCNGVPALNQALIRLQLPHDATLELVTNIADIPLDWRDQEALTRAIGVRWRRSQTTLGLWVPSVVEPSEFNLLLNPDHPQFPLIQLFVERNPFQFDTRLFD